jgi:F-type H+-transporting ATPase subunit gamma
VASDQPSTPDIPNTEPDDATIFGAVFTHLLEAKLYQAVVEARAAEQAARMIAMQNASDNAGDLIEDLTLARNNARQAAITQELAEISGGAEAINNS